MDEEQKPRLTVRVSVSIFPEGRPTSDLFYGTVTLPFVDEGETSQRARADVSALITQGISTTPVQEALSRE